MPLVAGVDCSTQSTKVLVVDPEDGHVVATGAAVHEVEGVGGARETDPRDWERSVASALAQTGRAGEVASISIGGQQHGLVVLDERGRPLRKAPLWNDTRGAPDAEDLVDSIGGPEACAKRIGSVLTSSFTVAHWAWLRRTEPDLAAAARHVMLPHDYLNFRLTGSPATDRSDVSGTGWWSPTDEAYAPDVLALEAVRLNPALLAPVIAPEGVAGSVTGEAAQQFGLAAGTKVACGAGDNAAAALALDFGPGEAALSLGTSGTVYAPASAPSADPTGTVAGFASADGRYLPLACTLNATVAIDTVSDWLGLLREDVEPSEGVVFLPWLGGERTPNVPTASGTLSGLRYNTDKRAILQAAYEGLVATASGGDGLSRPVGAPKQRGPVASLGRRRPWPSVAANRAAPFRAPRPCRRVDRAGCVRRGCTGQCRLDGKAAWRGGEELGCPAGSAAGTSAARRRLAGTGGVVAPRRPRFALSAVRAAWACQSTLSVDRGQSTGVSRPGSVDRGQSTGVSRPGSSTLPGRVRAGSSQCSWCQCSWCQCSWCQCSWTQYSWAQCGRPREGRSPTRRLWWAREWRPRSTGTVRPTYARWAHRIVRNAASGSPGSFDRERPLSSREES